MSPASVLAHGGSDSDAFCDDECDWIYGDGYRPSMARDYDVHVRHGCVMLQKRPTWYGYCVCMYTGNRSRQLTSTACCKRVARN